MRARLGSLGVGDVFRADDGATVRILDVRAPEVVPTADTDKILVMLSGNVYTLERLDRPGASFEVTRDALEVVDVPLTAPNNPVSWAWAFAVLLGLLVALSLAVA